MTGSVNQRGEVQAIGGVNEKVEGFYKLCASRGLTGSQGEIIPRSNVRNLMLRAEVVDAIRAGAFHLYAVSTIDEGMWHLSGVSAGMPTINGVYPEESVNGRVSKTSAHLCAEPTPARHTADASPRAAAALLVTVTRGLAGKPQRG